MPSERLHPNPLSGLHGLLTSRGTHLALGLLTVFAVLFSGYDTTKTRPSDGTVWLLGRAKLEVLDVLSRPTGQPTPLQRGDQIVGISNIIVRSPQQAAQTLSQQNPGATVPYLILRKDPVSGQERQLLVQVPLTSTRVNIRDYSVNVVLALVFLVIGFALYLRSGNEQPATLTRHPFLAPLLYIMPLMFYFRFTLDQFIGAEGAKINATSWIVLGIYYVFSLSALPHLVERWRR